MSSFGKTLVIRLDPKRPDKRSISYAADALRNGRLVAFPTETVYGVGASLLRDEAVKRLYKVKARSRSKPFTVHISNPKLIREMGCEVPWQARALIDKFWPGPLTVILRSKYGKKIGFRMPADKIALAVISAAGVPVVLPSANLSGKTPPKNAGEVLAQLDGGIDVLLDGGKTRIGVESTVVDLTTGIPKILREGAIKSKEVFKLLNFKRR